MKYTFQHFVDISTSADSMQIINFNVGGVDVVTRCAHLFNAYKYFKLGKVSVKFVPASTLPVDPLGMSYSDSDPQTVDPRDQLNPGLVRITNGEDILTDLTGVSANQQEGMYQAMMLDPRWYKFSLQSGFKRTAVPLFWQVGQMHQDQYPGASINIPQLKASNVVNTADVSPVVSAAESGTSIDTLQFHKNFGQSSESGLFQTGHRGRLGYLPTDAYQYLFDFEGTYDGYKPMIHNVPSVRVITCVLPKAYKTVYYYRVYITETVYFSGLRSIAPTTISGSNYYARRGIDQFICPPAIFVRSPSDSNNSSPVSPNLPTNNGEGSSNDY